MAEGEWTFAPYLTISGELLNVYTITGPGVNLAIHAIPSEAEQWRLLCEALAALERKSAIAVEALQAVLEETGEFWKDGEPDDARKYLHQTAADALTALEEPT